MHSGGRRKEVPHSSSKRPFVQETGQFSCRENGAVDSKHVPKHPGHCSRRCTSPSGMSLGRISRTVLPEVQDQPPRGWPLCHLLMRSVIAAHAATPQSVYTRTHAHITHKKHGHACAHTAHVCLCTCAQSHTGVPVTCVHTCACDTALQRVHILHVHSYTYMYVHALTHAVTRV